ncbi:MAG: acyltransferase family protein [Clostridia bacterium]|nr:acyltransferase family protein [Clostridia bacterium]
MAGRKRLADLFLEKEHPASAADPSYRMRVLSVFAITFVVLGHMNFYARGQLEVTLTEPLTFHGWFPYYAFHLPLFLFISGYFFPDLPGGGAFFPAMLRWIGKKAAKLLLPYYVFSGLSLLAVSWLHPKGLTPWDTFSWAEWLAAPWIKPCLITFATPAWYLPALFLAELFLLLLRQAFRLFIRRGAARETALLAATLLAGAAAVYCKETAAPSEAAVVYLRSVVMLFFMQAGALYRRHLEKHDTLKSGWYFLMVFAAQLLLILLSGSSALSPELYALIGFGKTGYAYFIGGLTGLLLWLRISALAASVPRKSGLLSFIGKNTMYIMGLHTFAWFLFNTLLHALRGRYPFRALLSGFSSAHYQTLYYCCTKNPRMILLYYAVGMALPLLAAWLLRALFRLLRRAVRILDPPERI